MLYIGQIQIRKGKRFRVDGKGRIQDMGDRAGGFSVGRERDGDRVGDRVRDRVRDIGFGSGLGSGLGIGLGCWE